MVERTARISEEIKKELSVMMREQIKDPRLPELVSILKVETTRDLRYAKVFVSVYGDESKKKDAADALKSASGFMRRELGKCIKLHYTPELIFVIDSTIENGIRMSKLIDETMKK
jgi:ribosome-binding factor A